MLLKIKEETQTQQECKIGLQDIDKAWICQFNCNV